MRAEPDGQGVRSRPIAHSGFAGARSCGRTLSRAIRSNIWWSATARRCSSSMPSRVRAQYLRLAAALPGVDLHYAVKSLPHRVGRRHVCGRRAPISTSRPTAKSSWCAVSGVVPERCIHTHPIKRDGDIRTALSFGVDAIRRRQSGRAAQVRQFQNPRLVADSRRLPQRRCVRLFAQIRLRAGCRLRICSRSPPSCASRSRDCRSTPVRRRPGRPCTSRPSTCAAT